MARSHGIRSLFLLMTIYSIVLHSLPAKAQINTSGSSNCTAADFDTTIQFLNGPGDMFSLLVRKRNIRNHACVFDGSTYGPSIVPDRVEGGKAIGFCYFCDEQLANGRVTTGAPVTVAPGEVAQQTFRWKTKSANESIHCVSLKWIADPVLLATPSLLKPVCSDIDVSRFTVESPRGSGLRQDQDANSGQRAAFELSAERNRYNAGEYFSLNLAPISGSAAMTPRPERCPIFYLRQRSPDGATRIDEVQPMTSIGCKSFIPGHRPINSASSFEIEAGANTVGEHTLQVLQLVGSINDPQLEFVNSNVLRLEIADPVTMPRMWGTQVKGVAVDVSLEKDTYLVGESIPMHIAVEDLNAPFVIYTWDPLWDPCMTVGVQVLDLHGRRLTEGERFAEHSLCMGHGFGPRPIEKAKVIPIERTLEEEGWLPKNPGTYTIVVTWCPSAGEEHATHSGFAAKLKTYAKVEATVTIHIVPAEKGENAAESGERAIAGQHLLPPNRAALSQTSPDRVRRESSSSAVVFPRKTKATDDDQNGHMSFLRKR